jgi:hypothetical protein
MVKKPSHAIVPFFQAFQAQCGSVLSFKVRVSKLLLKKKTENDFSHLGQNSGGHLRHTLPVGGVGRRDDGPAARGLYLLAEKDEAGLAPGHQHHGYPLGGQHLCNAAAHPLGGAGYHRHLIVRVQEQS